MAQIHPTAIIDPTAELADDVAIGAYAVVEGDTRVGPGCTIRPHAVIRRYTRLGAGNYVDSYAVLGGLPQDLRFDPSQPTELIIGERNTFREHVTISRASSLQTPTTVGSDTYWMAGSHAGHDARIGDRVILANNVLLAGHVTVGERAIISGGAGVHQFCWVGEGVMSQGLTAISQHVAPWSLIQGVNQVVGMNRVGLRRHDELTDQDREQLTEAFALVYRRGLSRADALAEMDRRDPWGPAARRFTDFVRRVYEARPPHRRGLAGLRSGR